MRRAVSERGSLKVSRVPERGFTLIELMIIVVIIGVISSLAVVGYGRYMNEVKTSEAREIIGSIKAGQEAYLDETFQYLNVSATIDTLYPVPTPGQKTQWGAAAPGYTGFLALGVNVNAPVYFGYSTTARNGAGAPLDAGAGITGFGAIPVSDQPQYLVKAVADISPGGPVTAYVSSSIQADIYGENVGQ